MPILLINQDVDFLHKLKDACEAHGYKVIATTNSLMASQLFFQHKPRIVIINIAMRGKDGFEIIKEIRAFCQKTFILAISANHLYLRAVKHLGATEVLPYASEPSRIVNAIKLL